LLIEQLWQRPISLMAASLEVRIEPLVLQLSTVRLAKPAQSR
jgi:hypothetical protein